MAAKPLASILCETKNVWFCFSSENPVVEARLFRKAGLLDHERVQSPDSALSNGTFRNRTFLPEYSIAQKNSTFAWKESSQEKETLVMSEVDFSDDLWLFASPWCEQKLEDGGYEEQIALAWVALWNYTVDPTSIKTDDLTEVCKDLFEIPDNELTEILSKRMVAFFPDDNRLIERYRVTFHVEEFNIFVMFVEPNG